MKTFNRHPHLHNQPLRLSEAEKHDLISVIDDFFDCYHLHEVREILWNWLVEVISSPFATNPHERNNHIFFYEKIEALVEAAFIMQKRAERHRRKSKHQKKEQNYKHI